MTLVTILNIIIVRSHNGCHDKNNKQKWRIPEEIKLKQKGKKSVSPTAFLELLTIFEEARKVKENIINTKKQPFTNTNQYNQFTVS